MLAQRQKKQRRQIDPYQLQRIMSADKHQLTAYVLEVAIVGCNKRDRVKINRAIAELTSSLNFEYRDQAVVFYRVYRILNQLISRGKFDEAKSILVDLHQTWKKAFNLS
ncbi:MAG TPA: hypothetical protein PKV71_11005 [Calditrichia bacterium]|nr:hypothetical protein [Calditrichota bacterium]HQU72908.1 hypothetical protein [Calditrichia bacterium]HQV32399.1 hypothetical protein [Calditrichia bacterium]